MKRTLNSCRNPSCKPQRDAHWFAVEMKPDLMLRRFDVSRSSSQPKIRRAVRPPDDEVFWLALDDAPGGRASEYVGLADDWWKQTRKNRGAGMATRVVR